MLAFLFHAKSEELGVFEWITDSAKQITNIIDCILVASLSI